MSFNNEDSGTRALTQARDLGARLASLRLSRNLTQADVAREAGTSERTLKRLEAGENTSLDTFLRVLGVLRLADHLLAALPDPDVRPMERVKLKGHERRRARGRAAPAPASTWAWDEEPEA